MIGQTLAHYRVTAALGAGGMGEVYRATDTTLGRDVALKLLPATFASDPERLARFEREAKVLASLSHGTIAQVYGFEKATLADGSQAHVLVMELAEGEDLQARLKRGPLPLDEAIAVARQVAEALELAHEKGIVHRDLKPANVKVTPQGAVKVLDFGLAKAWASDGAASGSSADLSQSPTLARTGSAGLILGTAAYMSPEQARGRPVDQRADIWALGVLVYEMLAGRKLFDGETVTDVLAAVVRQEIDWSALPARTPAALRRLLRQCLERNPKNRLHSAADARLALDEAAADAPEQALASAPSRRPVGALWGAAALAAVLGLAAGWLLRRPAPKPEDGPWLLAIPEELALAVNEHPRIALSRDGRLQAVVVTDDRGTPRILLRRSGELEPRVVPETEGAAAPFFSPDSAWIGFLRPGGLYKVSTTGGSPARIAETTGQTRGASWGDDGFVYFAPDTVVGLSRVPESGGAVETFTRLDAARDERTHRWPEAIPGGDAVLFTSDTAASSEYYDDARIEVVRPSTGVRKVLVENASMARYASSGHLVFARGGALYAVPLDIRALEVRGQPAKVEDGVATDVGSGAVQFAVAPTGSMLYVPGASFASWNLVWVDREGGETNAQVPAAPYNEAALSPDGRRVALVGGQGGISDLWVADLERASITRLTFGENTSRPVWSPDGSKLAYAVRPKDVRPGNVMQIVLKAADGSQPAEVLLEGERGRAPSSFTPDGNSLLYDGLSANALQRDIWMVQLASPRQPVKLVEGPFMKELAVVSPDGRWLAYVSDEGGQQSVYVRPFPSGPGRFQISTGLGTEPRWSRDGRELFYRSADVLNRVSIDMRSGFVAGRPQPLFDRAATGGVVTTYGPAPDASRFFTFRSSAGPRSRRAVALDPGFAARLSAAYRR